MRRRNTTANLALCGLLAALAVCIMLLGSLIPFATFCCPVLASSLLIPVTERCGRNQAIVWHVAVSLLSLLLGPDMEANTLLICLGYYPILKQPVEKRLPRLLRVPLKLVWFNATVAAAYALMLFLFRMQAVMDEFYNSGAWLLAALLLIGNVTFLMYDVLLARLTLLYRRRSRR